MRQSAPFIGFIVLHVIQYEAVIGSQRNPLSVWRPCPSKRHTSGQLSDKLPDLACRYRDKVDLHRDFKGILIYTGCAEQNIFSIGRPDRIILADVRRPGEAARWVI